MGTGGYPSGEFVDDGACFGSRVPVMVLGIAKADLNPVGAVDGAVVALHVMLVFGGVGDDQEVPRIAS